jgi:hypothetical protein
MLRMMNGENEGGRDRKPEVDRVKQTIMEEEGMRTECKYHEKRQNPKQSKPPAGHKKLNKISDRRIDDGAQVGWTVPRNHERMTIVKGGTEVW